MSFRDLDNIEVEYQSKRQNVLEDFYIPCLKEAITYKRAVGYFSSSILLHITEGLGSIAMRGGKIQLLIAPTLEAKDYEAIKEGYEIRDYVSNKLTQQFDSEIEYPQKEDRYALLAHLISNNILDIKIAIVADIENDQSIFHEKLGVMHDSEGNVISFSGSSNETYNGFVGNYENIDVYCDWKSEDAEERCKKKESRFDMMWEDKEIGLCVISFPKTIKEEILKYKKDNFDYVELDKKLIRYLKQKEEKNDGPNIGNIELYDYQRLAIKSWVDHDYKGIFDMATGTGKTFTGCGAICELYKNKKRVFSIIICPYIHLVDQWAEDIKKFNINPLLCYGNNGYRKKLERLIRKFKRNTIDFACAIITNQSFSKEHIQNLIRKVLDDTLIVVDEAHNFGARMISNCMELDYPYRLALSATLDRYGDPLGTKKLYDFFGKKCITYDLERAIKENKLTRYYYYPVIVSLDDEELDQYKELSEKIVSYHYDREKDEMPEGLKRLLIKRARIVAGAKNKIYKLLEIMKEYKNDNNLLIYCGAIKYNSYDMNEDIDGKKQISIVCDKLINELNMNVAKFTAEESTETRKNILSAYKNNDLQALVAIKCLDEGMNVPAIKTAFILASSTNPKEYIQRRGRVLRKSEGKDFAVIYDFITIPRPLDEAMALPAIYKQQELGLIKKELYRLEDFAKLSENIYDSINARDSIKEAYDIDFITEEDLYD